MTTGQAAKEFCRVGLTYGPGNAVDVSIYDGRTADLPGWEACGFELMEHRPRQGVEEYVDNEKYELRNWDLARPDSLAPLIRLINRIRRENQALQDMRGLHFHATDNDQLLCYSKRGDDGAVLVVVNLDVTHAQSGFIDVDPRALGVHGDETFQVHDLLGEARYRWRPGKNFVQLDPRIMPAHIFRVRRHARNEHDFEYFV